MSIDSNLIAGASGKFFFCSPCSLKTPGNVIKRIPSQQHIAGHLASKEHKANLTLFAALRMNDAEVKANMRQRIDAVENKNPVTAGPVAYVASQAQAAQA